MLCQIGSHINSALWQLVSLCCIHSDIPTAWKHATVYPIPKPADWECNLNRTRPITLLETTRKALVRLINNRLSSIMVKHKILQGGNHAGLPGGSTLEPLRIINAIIDAGPRRLLDDPGGRPPCHARPVPGTSTSRGETALVPSGSRRSCSRRGLVGSELAAPACGRPRSRML